MWGTYFGQHMHSVLKLYPQLDNIININSHTNNNIINVEHQHYHQHFKKSNCDDVYYENEGTCTYMYFLPLKFSQYPSRPVPVPELFGKYPTRPVPKSKTPTRQTLLLVHDLFITCVFWCFTVISRV